MSAILNFCFTKQQAAELISRLDKALASLFTTKGNLEDKLSAYLSYQEKDEIIGIFEQNKIDTNNISSIQNCLKNLIQEIETAPVLTLRLSFDPNTQTVSKIHNWLALNLKKGVLLDIAVDETLMGGAIIEYNGRYKNYSLKKRFEKGLDTLQHE